MNDGLNLSCVSSLGNKKQGGVGLESERVHTPHIKDDMKYEEKTEILADVNEEAVIYHGIENALVGYLERFGQPPIAVYDHAKVIEALRDGDDEASYEAALEWYSYNTLGTWAGDGTPGFLHRFEEEECTESNGTSERHYGWWTKTVTRITETLKSFGRWLQRDGK